MGAFQLLYASGGSRPITATDIAEILTVSRANNARLGITGLLLFADNMFIQVLEGEEARVRDLVLRIRRDPRHRNFMELVSQSSPARAFGDWQMGFKRLDPDAAEDRSIFLASKDALSGRIDTADGGFMLQAVLAFAGRDFLATA